MSGSDRRGFLRELLRTAKETIDPIREEFTEATLGPGPLEPMSDDGSAVPVPAAPTTRLATPEELAALCAEVGLATRAEQAVGLARVSVRLTSDAGGTSRLGGAAPVGDELDWPTWHGEKLGLLLDVDLASLPRSLPLPQEGRLLLFAALGHPPSGRSPDDADAVGVFHVAAGEPAEGGLPVAASAELVLPIDPEGLELSPEELAAWDELRARLAAAQGVEVEELGGDYLALHRVLGWPDAFAHSMDTDAELVARGLDLDGDDLGDLRDEAEPWTLLLQVSSDAAAGVVLPLAERLFVWIRNEDLAAARFDDVRGFVR